MKRNLIIFLVVTIAAVAGFIYFTKEDVVFSKETSLYKAVPVTAPVFVEFSSIKAIPENNPLLLELVKNEDFAWLLEKFNDAVLTITNTKEIQNQLGKKPVVLALDFIGKNVLKPVIICEVSTSEELNGLVKLLEKLLGIPAASFKNRKYDGYRIVDIVDAHGKNRMHYCAADGLMMISTDAILVEKSIRQLTSHNITNVSNFKKVNKTVTARSDVAWYINHNRFPDLWANMLNGKTKESVNEFGEVLRTNFKREVQEIRNYASWSELDMTFDDDKISLNGISAVDDSLNHFLSVFNGQAAEYWQADKWLPKNTSFFIGFTFSERKLFFKNLEKYFELSSSYFEREGHIKKIEERFRVDTRNTLRSLVKNQVVAAITSVPAQTENMSTLFIVNNDTRNNSKALFENLIKNHAKSIKVEFSTLHSSFKADDGINYLIYKFPYPSLPGIWLGKLFRFSKANYATFYDNKLVFGSSQETLQKYLNDMIRESTLYVSPGYSDYRKAIENRANINAYLNVNRSFALNNTLLNNDISKAFETNEDVFRKFDAVGWQVVCEKNIFFNSINLTCSARPKVEERASWHSNIDARLAMKPQIVVNHQNKATKEIIVQDVNKRLHLIAADGQIVWSAKIQGEILGKIHQIDYYRNGRLQYLFNTKEKLYLIDRNGSKVANFPVILKSPASNGVNVFDYDNNRKYRYFVACENRKVYAYDHEGKIISGWKFGETASLVANPVQHFRVNNKDYIVFKDRTKVYIQNRQGQTRVDCEAKFENSKNPLVLNLNGIPKIVGTDITGKVYYLYFDGKFTEKEVDKFSENHFFTLSDINGNGVPDFVFVDGKRLSVLDENGNKLFSEKFDNTLTYGANLYPFSAKQKKIGITDVEDDRIYLYDAAGKLQPGFPLKGNSEFSIGELSNGQLSLVVGSEEGNLLNYVID